MKKGTWPWFQKPSCWVGVRTCSDLRKRQATNQRWPMRFIKVTPAIQWRKTIPRQNINSTLCESMEQIFVFTAE